ncbi:class IV adenylate cyclase [Pseudarthrobacter sp. TAF60_1]|uniref:class IV adenylate cyclase n=1 Tax=Pseudarthrobacter sp. TAF60_1 TaxID=3233071 RepID=UPI003F999701
MNIGLSMIEVEVKYRVEGKFASSLVMKHREIFRESVPQRDTVFLLGSTSFDEFVPGSPVLRVRTSGGISTVTLKRKLMPTGEMTEIETTVGNAAAAEEIFSNLGLTLVTDVVKTRTSGRISDVEVCVDEVRGLGWFVELERLVTNEQEVSQAHILISRTATELGLREDWIEQRKYDELLADRTKSKE